MDKQLKPWLSFVCKRLVTPAIRDCDFCDQITTCVYLMTRSGELASILSVAFLKYNGEHPFVRQTNGEFFKRKDSFLSQFGLRSV